MLRAIVFIILGLLWLSSAWALSVPLPHMSEAYMVWVIVSTVLVVFMTIPGVALFYGGSVREKNLLSILVQCFVIASIAAILWFVLGFSLSFGNGGSWQDWIGGFQHILAIDINLHDLDFMSTRLHELLFQMSFAMITPVLIIGGFAERMKFISALLFVILWEILVYYPVCHWFWGGGWLDQWGIMDFAGGAVVHINAGTAGLIAAIMLGRRRHREEQRMQPHNLSLVAIGTGMLWVGWFGFNGGSAWSLMGAAAAIVNTQVAAGVGAIVWMMLDLIFVKKAKGSGVFSGVITGLVAITPACGYVGVIGALVIALFATVLCYTLSCIKFRLAYDDALDAFGLHGVAGMVGALLTGVFAASALGGVGLDDGVSVGAQTLKQLVGILVVVAYSGGVTFILLLMIRKVLGLRVSAVSEAKGLDISSHGERAYHLGGGAKQDRVSESKGDVD